MFEWLIIGGGVHATTIAIKLRALGLPQHQLRIIDPNEYLMAQFDRQTKRIGMPYLRSPLVHHCHPDPFDLKKFSQIEKYAQPMRGPYQRPRLDMFMDHTFHWIKYYNLESCHIHQKALHLKRNNHYWSVTLDNHQTIKSTNVVLAMGTHHTPYIPKPFQNQPDVQHIHRLTELENISASHVVGSGISAAHLTLKHLKETDRTMHLWMKKTFEIHNFDADPGWLGPKNMESFQKETCLENRIKINRNERHKGSLPNEMYVKLKNYERAGRLIIHQAPILKLENHKIVTPHETIVYDGIELATGFKLDVMTQPLIKDLVFKYKAPLIKGFPIISTDLEWLPHLYVSGMLADLELGPFARNIMGGRQAAQRIGEVYLEQRTYKRIAN
ncbi:FAD/NAD(P)-binding protein [Staphylococcus canis]|uniref:SidA/IucD/PvdA family monooxygenase n=1 Tax=Staphylococcus canis TaxID=2724942 RepID=A0ABS0TCC7_9STAP|nr:FAD/NAD(P)-binding protein [Staphylococcus canis]MBI5976042.1 SidA/IucD/PvdA family monooxygenase [Staphylococcus canis]